MPEVVTGHQLNARLDDIIERAEQSLLLVSPYIRLHHRFADAIKKLRDYPKIEVWVCFGKAKGSYASSFHPDAIELLKSLPNISIRYDERLHAKFYGNENAALITSMNLYDFSQDNNIEVGVFASKEEGRVGRDMWQQAHDLFNDIVKNAKTVFDREPLWETKRYNPFAKPEYKGSETKIDLFDSEPIESKFTRKEKQVVNPSMQPLEEKQASSIGFQAPKPANQKPQKKDRMGFCIRTGIEIPFNIERPFSNKAYNSWLRFENPDYEESYCHFTGEPSEGRTSMNKPILNKNWKAAKRFID